MFGFRLHPGEEVVCRVHEARTRLPACLAQQHVVSRIAIFHEESCTLTARSCIISLPVLIVSSYWVGADQPVPGHALCAASGAAGAGGPAALDVRTLSCPLIFYFGKGICMCHTPECGYGMRPYS